MRKMKTKLTCAALGAALLLTAGCGTKKPGAAPSPSDPGKEGIMIENQIHKEKIITEASFKLPKNPADRKADFTIPVLFTDGCVLQANMAVRLWGKCVSDGGIAVRLTKDDDGMSKVFYGKTENNSFELFIEGQDYGGPYTLEFISESGSCYTMKDILFGEVYVLGGQSNMGWALGQCYDGSTDKMLYQEIIDSSENPEIREMLVWPVSSKTPVESLESCRSWRKITPATVKEVSAVGYFFARRFYDIQKVPVGLVAACMGGTPLSDWEIGGQWYNGQVNPIKKMTVRGVLWYQGEGDPENYGERLAKLIGTWREAFDNPGLLWATVQLPRYIGEESYYISREEDKKAGTLVDNYTYCVTIDTGLYPDLAAKGDTLNADGIHPYEKEPVGSRLADAVIGAFYGKEGLWTSPYAQSAAANEDGSVTVTFANVGGGLMLAGIAGFELAGADGRFYDAVPTLLSENEISLRCDDVTAPVTVRYGYKNFSTLIEGPVTSCAQSVCVYNTKPDAAQEKAYPAEQFTISLK
ncbi:MAG: sialate O-acetylesterase [Clostridia bacterium]